MKSANFYDYDIKSRKKVGRQELVDMSIKEACGNALNSVFTYKLKPTFKSRMIFNNGYGLDIIKDPIFKDKYEVAVIIGVSLEDSIVFSKMNTKLAGHHICDGVANNLTLHEAFEIAEELQQLKKKAKGFSTNIIIG